MKSQFSVAQPVLAFDTTKENDRMSSKEKYIKASFGLKEILEEKKNELSPHSKNPPFFLQISFNPKEP
jgi:hypothetical protein